MILKILDNKIVFTEKFLNLSKENKIRKKKKQNQMNLKRKKLML